MKKYPLLQSQIGVFMECIKHPESTQYNLPVKVNLDDRVDLDRLESAFCEIIKARAVYRNCYEVDKEGNIYQWPDEAMKPNVIKRKCSEIEFNEYLAEGFVRPFDVLSGEPLHRIEIVETEEMAHLLMDFHHSIMDGFGFTKLANKDFDKVYEGKSEKEDYSIYELAENEQGLTETLEYISAREYITQKFKDKEFVTLSNGDGNTLGQMLRVSSYIDREKCDSWCKENGISIDNLFQAAFCHVMGVLTRNEHIVYGTAYHGRNTKERLKAAGMFVNTVPVLADVSGNLTVRGLIENLQRELKQSFAGGVYPIRHMFTDLNNFPKVIFNFEAIKSMSTNIKIGGVIYEAVELLRGKLQDDIDIHIKLYEDIYDIRVESSEAMNSTEILTIVANAIHSTVLNMMDNIDEKLKNIPIISGEEEENIIALSKGKDLEYDSAKTWIDMFTGCAKIQPEHIAVVDSVSRYTYGELDGLSDKIASYLAANGVCENDFIAIKMGRVKEFVAAIIGIQKAGAAYVPIDPEYPSDRISYMIENSEAKFVLTEEKISDIFASDIKVVSVNKAKPENYAYMIYTSGSTGMPKGAMIYHKGLRAFVEWNNKSFGHNSSSSHLVHASFSFDASVFDMLCPLAVGAKVHIASDELRHDLTLTADYVNKNNITGMLVTTQIGMALIDDFDVNLNYIMLGGEKMLPVRKTQTRVYNAYGPTEFTAASSFYPVNGDETIIPIGRPVPNTYSFICDAKGNLLPRGVVGELCLSGVQIGAGYWKLPEKTAEVFVECPFMPGTKMYRTGDLARYNEDGNLEYMGRIDFQVKLRGFRIELGEIENRAAAYPEIKLVNAQVRKDRLVLYYTADNEINKESLKSFLAESLTEYMVPTEYMQLKEMPMTPNGKVNTKVLPDPEMVLEEIVKPSNELEDKLLSFVLEVVDVQEAGVTNNLISLGMSSLAAMRLSAMINTELNCQIPVAEIMKNPTVQGIAGFISDARNTESKIKHYEEREYYPLTENQRGIYIDWEMNRETTQYNIPSVYKFTNKNVNNLANAVKTAIDTHSTLKTGFVIYNDDVMQKPSIAAKVEIVTADLTEEPSDAFFQSRVKPFNLLKDKLYRVEIYTCNEYVYLFMDIHHILYDGLSTDVLLNDILAAYEGEEIRAEEITALDFALYESELTKSDEYKKAESYFDDLVADATAVSYADSKSLKVGDNDESKLASLTVGIPADSIDKTCAKYSITASSYLNAAFAETIQRISREENPMYLTISNGREADVRLSECVGMFVKTLPVVLKTDNHGEERVEDYIKAFHAQLQNSIANNYYPYTKVVEKYQLKGEMMFVYQGGISENVELEGVENIPLSLDTVKLPVSVTAYPSDGNYMFEIEYDGNRYAKEDMELLANAIKNVAISMTTAKKVSNIKLVGSDEEKDIVELSKGEVLDYDRSSTWIDILSQNVKKIADKIAVVDEHSEISYGELAKMSDKIASYLVANDVCENDFIAIKMGRVKEFVATVIGIHKAGAAYVPIDSDYPLDRISYMLKDSEAKFVLTEEKIAEILASDIEVVSVNKAKPENRAYMIYTSGSTGNPKGVVISHRAMMNFLNFIKSKWNLTENSRIICHSNFSFDASVEDLYSPLIAGSTMFIVPDAERKDIILMRKYLVENNITGGSYTTQFGQLLADVELDLEYMCVGGEKMTSVPKVTGPVYNVYGPTEFTVDATYYELDKNTEYTNIPIGRPLHNCYAFVADKYGNLLPNGLIGELCLAGPQISDGYWKLPEKTAEVFVECPFMPGTKMYRTGDLARYNEDGNLEYMGRIDFQVKLRGFRIELGEIENRAAAYPEIKLVNAQVRKDRLVLYYTADNEINKESLKSFLAESLTEYMVPTVYMQLKEMPMTPNGKVNTKVLPDLEIQLAKMVEPDGIMENKMLEAARTVLPDMKFGVTDDLMEMGMSSLLAIKFVMLVNKFNTHVRVTDVMRFRTIREIVNSKVRIFWMYDEYDPEKPTLVFVHGIVVVNVTMPKFAAWSKYFNIMIIEPVDEHYRKVLEGEYFDEMINFYKMILDNNIPEKANVFAFMGFSYGGEVAAYLANEWHREYGNYPAIIMGDSYFDSSQNDSSTISEESIEKAMPDSYKEYLSAKDMVYKHKIILDMNKGRSELSYYDGRCIMLRAKADSLDVKDNFDPRVDTLKEYMPKLEIVDFPEYNHDDMFLNQSLIDKYTEILLAVAKDSSK